MKKAMSLLLVLAMMVALLAGCGSGSSDSSPSDDADAATSDAANPDADGEDEGDGDSKFVFGAAMYDLTNTFYVNMMNAGNEAAEDYGVEVIWKSAEGSLDNEISIIENFIQQGVDCILIDPIDAEGIKSVINEAGEAGIPCITMGNLVDTEYNYNTLYNDYEDSYVIAKIIAESVGGEGTVGLVYGSSGNYCSDQRQAGFEAGIGEYPNITLVSQPGEFDADTGMTVAADMITAYPDIVAIHSISDSQSYGVLQAIQAADKSDDVMLTSYDGEQEASDYVGSGEFALTLLTGSKRVGYWNVKVAYEICSGETVETKEYLSSYFVIGDTLAEKVEGWGLLDAGRILNPAGGREMFDEYRADLGPAS